MKKRRLKKKFIVLCASILSVLIIALGLIFIGFHNEKPKEKPKEVEQKEEKKEKPKEVYENPLPALRERYQNDDIIAEFSIPSLDLTEPVVKTSDNDYYLTHNAEKNEYNGGATFMDYRTINVDEDKQINIYGHNSDYYILPFKKLEQYLQEDSFYNNLDMVLKTDNAKHSYKVFAASIVEKDNNEHMYLFYKEEAFLNHVQKMRSLAVIDTGENITKKDRLLIIQTCLFNPSRNLVIIAKEVSS